LLLLKVEGELPLYIFKIRCKDSLLCNYVVEFFVRSIYRKVSE
jgi:hypothetical protein